MINFSLMQGGSNGPPPGGGGRKPNSSSKKQARKDLLSLELTISIILGVVMGAFWILVGSLCIESGRQNNGTFLDLTAHNITQLDACAAAGGAGVSSGSLSLLFGIYLLVMLVRGLVGGGRGLPGFSARLRLVERVRRTTRRCWQALGGAAAVGFGVASLTSGVLCLRSTVGDLLSNAGFGNSTMPNDTSNALAPHASASCTVVSELDEAMGTVGVIGGLVCAILAIQQLCRPAPLWDSQPLEAIVEQTAGWSVAPMSYSEESIWLHMQESNDHHSTGANDGSNDSGSEDEEVLMKETSL